jgi:DNA-directed RNA polymerase specialized sigma54-like protein
MINKKDFRANCRKHDDDGYLRRETAAIVDDLAFRQNIDSNEAEVEQVIHMIQQFDPPGVAARNLQECLLLQLERMKRDNKALTWLLMCLPTILMSLQRNITIRFSAD